MELRRELLLSIAVVMILNLTLAFGAIGLLGRMGPAIRRILDDNVFSIVAAEDMLAELALVDEAGADEAARARFEEALSRVERNVTENSEEPVLRAVRDLAPPALAGGPDEKAQLVVQLQELIRINRDAMQRVDLEAQRLGEAGAWAAVLVGALSFALTLATFARLRRRIVRPIVELHDTLESVQSGNRLRRARKLDAPVEITHVVHTVNTLLDDRLREHGGGDLRSRREGLEELALREMLDATPTPAAVIDPEGEIVRANQSMLDALSGDEGAGLRAAMRPDEERTVALDRTRLGDAGWLVRVPAETR